MTAQQSHRILDALIEQDSCFAVFRPPGGDGIRFVMQTSGEPALLRDIGGLDGRRGFVIAPFRINAASPLIVIRPDRTAFPEAVIPTPGKRRQKADRQKHTTLDKAGYGRLFDRFHQPLANGEFQKLVLSRSMTVDREAAFSPGRAFFNAVGKYPRSYVYLFHTPQSGTWLGSTPELLLGGTKDEWQTVALAGTRYPNSGIVTWDDKNLREQHLVTSYLLRQLSSFHISPDINGPYTIHAGKLAHLRTDFSFNRPETPEAGTLLKALHPTPAVSGLPKDDAYRFILRNEGQDRLYYTGFLGMLDTEGETGIYVNLRCMHIGEKLLTLFAGSGLLVSSSLDDEWAETGHKLEVMLNILG